MFRETLANRVISIQHTGIKSLRKELTETEFYDPSQIKDYQNNKLRQLIQHSYLNVPYYKQIFDEHKIKPVDIKSIEDLAMLPILEKSTIQRNFHLLTASNSAKYFKRTTSGSTGAPLKILYDKGNKLIEISLMLRFLSGIGKDIGSKEINLWGRPDNTTWAKLIRFIKGFLYNTEFWNVYLFKDKDYSDIISKIMKNPKIHLRGFTQAVFMLACKLRENNISINVEAVSVTAEKLLNAQREVIERYLTKNLYDQYGCGEVNSIAFECNHHNGLHHAFEHSVLEIVNDDNTVAMNKGAVVITNLDNYAMPLIRYRNGDLIKLSDKICDCGRSGNLIQSIDGRLYDFLVGANGVKVHSAFLDHILVDSNLLERYKVREMRIIQTEVEVLVLQYVSELEIPEVSFKSFEHEIIEHLGVMKIIYLKKDFLKDTRNGKRRFVIPLNEYLKDPAIL